jgi:signal transduction histidine kinase/ActR/RegA family two-component response regulator
MHAPVELNSRYQLSSKNSEEPELDDSAPQSENERVMVVAPLGRDATSIADLLNANGFAASICSDPSTDADQLVSAGALIMTEEALEFAQIGYLLAALKNQPPWSELPVIILTSGGRSRLAQLLDVTARAARSATLLERPIATDTLLRAINVALRSRRRQYEVRDLIFEQQRIQQKLEKNEEQLRMLLARERGLRQAADEANRLKDEFLATISHELRNPLNVMLGYSELLLRMDEIKQSPQLLQMSEALRRNALAQSYLIRDLLELSRLRSGKLTLNLEIVSLATTINNAIETVRADANNKNISIDLALPISPIFLEGDSLRLEQIIWNLLSNSVKFTNSGGKILVGLQRENGDAVLTVQDTGQGIHPSFLPKVFDMFRQGDSRASREHSGLGIGLALVQQLVRLHSGSVEAFSEGVGKGTTFTIRLPEKSGVKDIESNGAVPDVLVGLNGLRVLAVDDDEDNTSLLRQLLELNGAQVLTANSGSTALALAANSDFDLVLSDISMPGMDGFEFVRHLRKLDGKENVRVIALTGFGRRDDIEQARSEGFVAHLTKPIDIDALLKLLQRVSRNDESKTRDV